MARMSKLEDYLRRVSAQKQWIEKCGGSLPGYIDNYAGRYDRSEEQAAKIYEADMNELRRLEETVEALRKHKKGGTRAS